MVLCISQEVQRSALDPRSLLYHLCLLWPHPTQLTMLSQKTIEHWGIISLWWDLYKHRNPKTQFSSVQFGHSVMSDSLQPHELQHARPSPTPGVHSNSCPLSWWCHPAISFSVVPFSSCLQSLSASESFPMSQLFSWGGQSIGVSASASVLPNNTQDWSPSEWTRWISLQSKGLSRIFSNTTVQKHQFFGDQHSSQSNFHNHTWPLEKPLPSLDGPLLAK